MKTKSENKINKNWGLPGKLISVEDFQEGIKNAEKGPFHTIENAKKIMTGWREQRNSR